MKNTLVFTATYNERDNIKKLISEIFKFSNEINVFVIDDNSPDGTQEILKEIKIKNDNFSFLIREKKLGLNTAHKIAYEYAIKNNYNKLITLDADFSHDPAEIPKIINLLDHHDFVIGSRYTKGGKKIYKRFTEPLLGQY